MPSFLGQGFALSLGPHGAELALRGGLWRPRFQLLESVVWEAQASDAQRGAALDALLLRHAVAGSTLHVLVADVWTPTASVQPPANGATLEDLQAAVALRLRAVTDGTTGWEAASEPRVSGRFVASALRSGLLDVLRKQCQRHGLHLVSVQPVFAAVWNHWHSALANGQWLGICSAGVLTLCVAPKLHMEQLRRLDFAAQDAENPRWPVDAAQRESLRLGLPVPATLALCGAVPLPWRDTMQAVASARDAASVVYLGPVGDAPSLWGLRT